MRMVVIFLGAVLSSGCSSMIRVTETRALTAPHAAGSAIAVETSNGSVDIAVSPELSEIEVEAQITSGGATDAAARERLADSHVVVEDLPSGGILFRPIFPDGRRSGDGCSFVIRTPSADGVSVRTSNGWIQLTDARGAANLDSSNGDVVVTSHDGDLVVETSNGGVRVEQLRGSIDARTSNGGMEIAGADGPVVLRSSNGPIHFRASSVHQAPFECRTSNASVEVHLPGAAAASIDASTSNGAVKVVDRVGAQVAHRGGDDDSRVIDVRGGGPSSIVKTSNGRITIVVGE